VARPKKTRMTRRGDEENKEEEGVRSEEDEE
jgi:hypothetical protein